MKKILMVCMGNICRSPMAEGIMRQKIADYKLDAIVDSAGTISFHAGENPDERAISTAKKHHIDISRLVARQFKQSDFTEFDYIFVMDRTNLNDILRNITNDDYRRKVRLIMNSVFSDQNIEVPDPYYGGNNGFENVFAMLDRACNEIALSIKRNDLL
jgi:protein-tyrosine phosphatase